LSEQNIVVLYASLYTHIFGTVPTSSVLCPHKSIAPTATSFWPPLFCTQWHGLSIQTAIWHANSYLLCPTFTHT